MVDAASACPDDAALQKYVDGLGNREEGRDIELHIERCSACRETLMLFALVSVAPWASADADIEARAPRRYQLRALLGVGGQGAVWRAWDAKLCREVALKFVDLGESRTRVALRTEARSLARVQHAGVVEIYDVQLTESPGYISMALCRAGSLADRISPARPARELAARFSEVAEALALLHGAGILHRDLKPSNLLVRDDGGLLLGDFGLATEASSTGGSPGDRCGTPAYMAPEMLTGGRHTPATDQYAFFVALSQALAGSPIPTPRARLPRSVPRWIRRVVRRGLDSEPGRRFEDMRAVARALRREGSSVSRGASLAAAGAFAAGGLLLTGPWGNPGRSCERREPIEDWDQSVRAEVRARVRADTIISRIDRYADGWRAADRAACGREAVRRCLWRQRERIDEWATEVREATDDAAMKRLEQSLPRWTEYGYCVDARDDGIAVPHVARRTERVQRQIHETVAFAERGGDPLLEAEAWLQRGLHVGMIDVDHVAADEAFSFTGAALARGGSPHWLSAALAKAQARLDVNRQRHADAQRHASTCIDHALRIEDWDAAARCEGLLSAVLSSQGQDDLALEALESARVHHARTGQSPGDAAGLELDFRYASLLESSGSLKAASEAYAALADTLDATQPESANRSLALTSLGRVQLALGQPRAARRSLRAAVEIEERNDAPARVAMAQQYLAVTEAALGNVDEARRILASARTVLESDVLGDHDALAQIEALVESYASPPEAPTSGLDSK